MYVKLFLPITQPCINSNLGVLFRGSFWGGGQKITRCLKLVRIMLETWHLVRKYTHIFSFRKYTF